METLTQLKKNIKHKETPISLNNQKNNAGLINLTLQQKKHNEALTLLKKKKKKARHCNNRKTVNFINLILLE